MDVLAIGLFQHTHTPVLVVHLYSHMNDRHYCSVLFYVVFFYSALRNSTMCGRKALMGCN